MIPVEKNNVLPDVLSLRVVLALRQIDLLQRKRLNSVQRIWNGCYAKYFIHFWGKKIGLFLKNQCHDSIFFVNYQYFEYHETGHEAARYVFLFYVGCFTPTIKKLEWVAPTPHILPGTDQFKE
jgi:hypothetical protein